MVASTMLTYEDFVDVLASKEPTPGGGGAAALVGAVGMALGNMVGSLTVGKPKYADVEDDIVTLKDRADALQHRLLDLVAKDAEVFRSLSKAYGMPHATEEERAEKARVMEKCLKECCDVPIEIMQAACEAIEVCAEFAAKGSALAISDAGCGVICCKAALQAAALIVSANTKSMTERDYAEQINENARLMLEVYCAKADQVYAEVEARFQ